MTRVVGLIASKGGVGKSTLTINLAMHAVEGGARVAILDGEPQESVTFWWRKRGEPRNPELKRTEDPVEDAAELRGDGYDWILIDTIPASMQHVERAVEASDVVIIPSKVSAFDLMAVRAVVGFCRIHKKPYALVLNDTDPDWGAGIRSAAKLLKTLGTVVPKNIRHRTVYASTLTTGKAAFEDRNTKEANAARKEIAAVWRAIKTKARGK